MGSMLTLIPLAIFLSVLGSLVMFGDVMPLRGQITVTILGIVVTLAHAVRNSAEHTYVCNCAVCRGTS